jgi:aquaporin Z
MGNLAWWKQLHWPEYAAEFLGTGLFIFLALSVITFDFGTCSPLKHLVPDVSMRFLIRGLLVGASGSLIAISPLGRLSGAHLNPALSLAFWVQGKMHHRDIAGYIVSQFLGALSGAVLVVQVWRACSASVRNGMTLPGADYSLWSVFLVEMSMTFLLVLSIFLFVSSYRLMRWTPLITWFLVTLTTWIVGPISGSSLNPARSLGPAIVTAMWYAQWIYCVAPPLGALLAVGAFRLLRMPNNVIC